MTLQKLSKKDIYAKHGIIYDPKTQTIHTPIPAARPIVSTEILQPGNEKTGKEVLTLSTLATNKIIDTIYGKVRGTCCCTCPNCYACTGCYTFKDVKNALALRTILAREYIQFLEDAITAQLEYIELKNPDKIQEIRISAAGDLFNDSYVEMLQRIIERFPRFIFWTYTKYEKYINSFDKYSNANIVKSILPDGSLNYGTIKEVFERYIYMVEHGYNVHLCSCGVRSWQHCHNCAGCAKNDFVLFFKHSARDYDIQNDQLFEFAAMACYMVRNAAPIEDIISVMRAGLEIVSELEKDGKRAAAVLKFKKVKSSSKRAAKKAA